MNAFRNFVSVFALVFLLPGVITADICNDLQTTIVKDQQWPNASGSGSCSDGDYTLSGQGHDIWWGWDRGAIAAFLVNGTQDLTFSAQVTAAPSEGKVKYGIMAREKLTSNSRMVALLFDGNPNSWNWVYRQLEGISGDEKNTSVFSSGDAGVSSRKAYLKLERKSNRWTSYISEDGQSWESVKDNMVIPSATTYLGFAISHPDMVVSATFSNIACTGCAASNYVSAQRSWLAARDKQNSGYYDLRGRQIPHQNKSVGLKIMAIDRATMPSIMLMAK